MPILAAINSKNHTTHPPTHPHTHTHTHACACAHTYKVNTVSWHLHGETVENIKTASAKKAGLQAHIQTQTSQLRHKSDYYLLHLVACTKHFKEVKNKKHSYCVQRTVAEWYHSKTISCIREKGMFKLFHLLQRLVYNNE
jgi:hypothetical protein